MAPRTASFKAIVGAALFRGARRYSLVHRNALVMGGSRGVGFEVARLLVERGSSVALIGDNAFDLEQALVDLRPRAKNKNRVVGVMGDLADQGGIDQWVNTVRLTLGPIDVFVNNAGGCDVGALQIHDDMRRRGGGRIANLGSFGALSPGTHAEFAKDGIVVLTFVLPDTAKSSTRVASSIVDALESGQHSVAQRLTSQLEQLAKSLCPPQLVALFGAVTVVE